MDTGPADTGPADAGPADAGPADAGPVRAGWPGPVGRPAGAHWWSVQPPPPAGPISAGRAYAEVLIVFAAFFAASVIAGGEELAGRFPRPFGSWAVFAPLAVSALARCVLAVLVVVLLSARRGITPRLLGFGWARKGDGTPGAAQNLRIGAWGILALVTGLGITVWLAHGHRVLQPLHQDYGYLVYSLAASLSAGIVEESVALAFVVTTLRQARRPLPEIVVVAVLLRCSYHDYYGYGMIGIAIWATAFIWLFLRSGSVLPLIVLHVLWDAWQFLGHRWPAAADVGRFVVVLAPVIAGLTWLMSAARRTQRYQALTGGDASAWPPSG